MEQHFVGNLFQGPNVEDCGHRGHRFNTFNDSDAVYGSCHIVVIFRRDFFVILYSISILGLHLQAVYGLMDGTHICSKVYFNLLLDCTLLYFICVVFQWNRGNCESFSEVHPGNNGKNLTHLCSAVIRCSCNAPRLCLEK